MSINMIAGETGNVQPNNRRFEPDLSFAAAPPLNPTVDDARVARAEWWLFNDCPDAGDDRFASAVEAAAVLRDTYNLSSLLAEAQLNDIWNRVACEPPLTPSQIAQAVRQAYCWQATPAPSTAAQQAEQPDDVSPPSLNVETTDAVDTAAPVDAVPSAATERVPSSVTASSVVAQDSHVEPNTDAAVAFLESLDPTRRHDLFAIHPDSPKGAPGKTEAKTFLANQRAQMEKWINENQGRRNIYYTVNGARDSAPIDQRIDQKERKDVGVIRAFVADLDADKVVDPSGNNFRKERERLRGVAEAIASDEYVPTHIIDSGGGYQPCWLLDPPLVATPENVELAEGIGRAIQQRWGGDSVWDMVRIMRLPGTINVLSPDKRKRGRAPAVATIIAELSSDKKYTIEQLKAAFPPIPHRPGKKAQDRKLPEIDMDVVWETQANGKLPEELQQRFDAARARHSGLNRLWNGEETVGDGTPSDQEYALVGRLKRLGNFTPTECAQIISIWDRQSEKHADEIERRVGRCWMNNPGYDGKSFKPMEIEKSKNVAAPADSKDALSEAATAWEAPTDFWLDEADDPPDLPRGVVPAIIEGVARDHALRLGVEAGAPAAALITAMGSLVHAGNCLQMRQNDPDWMVRAILWTAVIGDPSSNKTAVLSYATKAVRALDTKLKQESDIALKKFHHRRRWAKKSKAGTTPQTFEAATTDDLFEEPLFKQKIINDATTEAIANVNAANPSGVLNFRDELSGFFGAMDLYHQKGGTGGGTDRAFWLEAKDGGSYTVNRKGHEPIFVKHNAISVLGGIQPDRLRSISAGLTDDGLMQRFSPIFLRRVDGEEVDVAGNQGLADSLMAVATAIHDDDEPNKYRFAPEADKERRAYRAFVDREIHRSEESPSLRQWLEKSVNEFGRLALVFNFLNWHSSDVGSIVGGPPPELVSVETARMARRYLTEFVYPHARVFYRKVLGSSPIEECARWIAGHILARKLTSIANRDVKQNCKPLKNPEKRGALISTMQHLYEHEWIKPARGQPPHLAKSWLVNPAVHVRFVDQAQEEWTRRESHLENIRRNVEIRRTEKDNKAGGGELFQ